MYIVIVEHVTDSVITGVVGPYATQQEAEASVAAILADQQPGTYINTAFHIREVDDPAVLAPLANSRFQQWGGDV